VLAIALRQYYLLRGSPVRILPMFAWVAIDIVLWGFISRYLNTVAHGGIDFVTQLLGAVLFWDFFSRIMQGVTVAFLEDVWSRNFLNLFGSPMRIGEYVGGLVLTSIVTSTLGLIVMLVLATAVFGLPLFSLGLLLAPVLAILFLFGIALGILGSALVLRFGPASEWLIWPIPALLAPFAAVFYPVSTLPPWMRTLSQALPPSYVFESLRAAVAGRPLPTGGGLLFSAVLAIAYVVLCGGCFAWVYRFVVRTGRLARYGAEGTG
jgi:ABC-2 type transport system permease protein